MKVGDVLIAINPCKMGGDGHNALTIGKSYKVITCNYEQFAIIDDIKSEHWFTLTHDDYHWKKFFSKKEGNILRLLNKIDENV